MPDRYDNANIIDKAYDIATKTQLTLGEQAPDEVSFVMGFIACFGIMTGRVDIGLDMEAPLTEVFDAIHRDILDFGRRVAANQAVDNAVRDAINGFRN